MYHTLLQGVFKIKQNFWRQYGKVYQDWITFAIACLLVKILCDCSSIYNSRFLIFWQNPYHGGKVLAKSKLKQFKNKTKKLWLRWSKTFLLCEVSRNLSILIQSLISFESKINQPVSPVKLYFSLAVSCKNINVDKIAFNLAKFFCQDLTVKLVSKFSVSFVTVPFFNELDLSKYL